MPAVRFEGPRWAIAMCDSDWRRFCEDVPPAANERLTAVFEHLCAHGEAGLRSTVRWMSRAREDPAARRGAVEARGTAIHGHRSEIGGRSAFFVTGIVIDERTEPNAVRCVRPARDARQGTLPLGNGSKGEDVDDG